MRHFYAVEMGEDRRKVVAIHVFNDQLTREKYLDNNWDIAKKSTRAEAIRLTSGYDYIETTYEGFAFDVYTTIVNGDGDMIIYHHKLYDF